MEEIQQAISRLEAHIRGMSVPTQDRIWWRFRQEQMLLGQLLNFDLRLVRECEQLYQFIMHTTPEVWQTYGSGPLRPQIQQISQIASDRERFLLLQV